MVTESFGVERWGGRWSYGQDDYNQFQAEIEESLPEKGVVLKRLDILDPVLEKAQLERGQHE
jgi:hypothetical protein